MRKPKNNFFLWSEKACAYCGRPMFLSIGRQSQTSLNRKCHIQCAQSYLRLHQKPHVRSPKFEHHTDIGAYMGYELIGMKMGITAQAVHGNEKSALRKFLRRLREKHKVEWNEFRKEFFITFGSENEMLMIVYLIIIYFADEFKRKLLTHKNR